MSNKTYKGIVLRSVKYGEHDRILTLFTLERGKLSAVAKGAQSPKCRYIASCQSYCLSEFVLSENLKMPYVVSADVVRGFYGLINDPASLIAAGYASELTETCFEEDSPEEAAFMLLYHTLKILEENPGGSAITAATAFALKLMGINGTYPVLDRCASCGRKTGKYYFSPQSGGTVCDDCSSPEETERLTSAEAMYLYDLLYKNINDIAGMDAFDGMTRKYLFRTVNEYCVYILGRNIKSSELMYSF
ncbi:MAG: DNA repair protein RecO [Eubacteriaceae bacterium]|nr:DNA repair protein RecO [Eubacteriaceae bacterium]